MHAELQVAASELRAANPIKPWPYLQGSGLDLFGVNGGHPYHANLRLTVAHAQPGKI